MTAQPYRMIAIDLDGTLLSPDGSVTDRTRAAVHGCLDAGLLVCFATGRNWTESRTVLDAVAHFATAVFAGGAMVIDTKQEVTLHRTLMGADLARELCGLLERNRHAVLALQDTGAAGVDYLVSDEVPLNAETRHWMTATGAKVRRVRALAEYAHPHTIRLGIVAGPAEVRSVHAELVAAYGERVFCHAIAVPQAGVEVLEVFDPAVNKWEGILRVAGRHGIDPAQIIAVGDDTNDLPMLRHAGLSVAMGNARPEIKAAAKRVIGTNREDGLAAFLEELVASGAVEPLAPDLSPPA